MISELVLLSMIHGRERKGKRTRESPAVRFIQMPIGISQIVLSLFLPQKVQDNSVVTDSRSSLTFMIETVKNMNLYVLAGFIRENCGLLLSDINGSI